MPKIGFIGLGDIGLPIAQRILGAGFDLRVWNRSPDKALAIAAQGAEVAPSAADLGEHCDIVCTCVMGSDSVEAVVFGTDGIVARPKRVRLIIDNSTIDPGQAAEFAVRLRSLGIGFVDAPVSGAAVGARNGTLTVMAGGEAADIEAARAVIMTYAKRLNHVGPSGSGQAAKACNQIINFVTISAIAEAFNLAREFGIDVTRLPEILRGGFADSNLMREYARSTEAGESGGITDLINGLMASYGGHADPAFAAQPGRLLKDVNIALNLGQKTRCPLPLTGALGSVLHLLHASAGTELVPPVA